MGGNSGWATQEQRAFLLGYSTEYVACRVEKKYKDFWTKLFNAYLTKFPLVEEMFPGLTVSELSDDQRTEYGERLGKLQSVGRYSIHSAFPYLRSFATSIQRLKEWYRWQFNPRTRNVTAAISKKILKEIYKPRRRGLKTYEIFAKLYPQKVARAQREWCEREGIKGQQILGKWHAICKELLLSATEEERQAIDEELAARAQESDDDDDVDPDDLTPEILQRCVSIQPFSWFRSNRSWFG